MLFIMGVFLCCFKANAQEKQDECKHMIDSAIKLKYALLQKAPGKNDNYLENLYLLNEQDQPLNYLNSSNKFKFIRVYGNQSRKILAKGIYAWKVFTTLNQNQFTIKIIEFYITYKNHNYSFGNGGGSKTIFEFDCNQHKWLMLSSENSGL